MYIIGICFGKNHDVFCWDTKATIFNWPIWQPEWINRTDKIGNVFGVWGLTMNIK